MIEPFIETGKLSFEKNIEYQILKTNNNIYETQIFWVLLPLDSLIHQKMKFLST